MKSPVLFLSLSLLSSSACAAPASGRPATAGVANDGRAPDTAIVVPCETYTLPNGLTVTLHEDHTLPKVVIDTWFGVGSKDEEPGRTGFAHLFEHLMFMGTNRVPGSQFDEIMENAGGSNNASTSNDRTNYFSMGPSSILPTLLWLDADRLDALADAMTSEKVDRQREVVRNERRQNTENRPYGKAEVLLPPVLYPPGHPYAHSVIGSHEDLQAASLEDVKAFFHRYYVPANASLVVAGDFDPAEAKAVIAKTFGAVPARPAPTQPVVPRFGGPDAPRLDAIRRIVATDQVQFPKLTLVWHSPAFFQPGDAEMDLIASLLTDGPSSRLHRRLVTEMELAQSVRAYQASRELGSEFHIETIATPGADLDTIRATILEEIDRLAADGPEADELRRVKIQRESDFLRGMEGLFQRADAMNRYHHFFGTADGFQRDLDRWLGADASDVTDWTKRVFSEPFVDMRILPAGATVPEAALDEQPANFPPRELVPPLPTTFELSSGVPVHVVERRGTHLFSGSLIVAGGSSLVPADKAGLASLTARMLEAGAGGLDEAAFAAASDDLGASLSASASASALRVDVEGLTSHLDETLDRFREMVRDPNLTQEDFERQRALLEAAIEARSDNPSTVSREVSSSLVFGPEDPRGRPVTGRLETVRSLTIDDVWGARDSLLSPGNACFVFVGDFGPGGIAALRADLEERFGDWRSSGATPTVELPVKTDDGPGGLWLVHRPEAPQTVIALTRPIRPVDPVEREARRCVNAVFGGSFTSRLNQNLREDKGYTYGVGSGIRLQGGQPLFRVGTSVRTDVTGESLLEIRHEFELMREAGLRAEEFAKARENLRQRAADSIETTSSLESALARLLQEGRPVSELRDSLAALREVTPELAKKIAESDLFDFDRMTIVLVGDRDAILPQLEAAGLPAPTELIWE